MRTLITNLLLFVAASASMAQSYTGDTWKQTKKSGKGTLTLAYVQTPSFIYVDNSGQLTGICIDIMKDFRTWVKDNKKVDIEFKFVGDGSNFRGMYDKVKISKGGVVGLGNVTITEERKKEVKFSPPFITNFAILVTQNKVSNLNKLEDMPKTFSGLTAYTAKGTLNEKRTLELKEKYFPDLKITYTTTSQETLEKMLSDNKGMAYLDLAFYLEAVQLKKSVKRHPLADKAAEQFGFIMPSNSDWGTPFEEFFAANGGYLNTKEYKAILFKHLGEAGMKLMQSQSQAK
ncbi:substrate-binding periplasmic protein [Chryseolinea lacunae]|uniref:Transporter substrate-binding domain-containing protein n=1 Tax=Chryseolinea lacunae TaxID=2801331 RepID=A0ABS1KKR3_9BACT|nr:transporter substrate-binding domain-containing protein [Chryseolinea lacunae]MBL0739928.1 transporter substrate-binding domain-containing protein [Chryseolinea lacunae]